MSKAHGPDRSSGVQCSECAAAMDRLSYCQLSQFRHKFSASSRWKSTSSNLTTCLWIYRHAQLARIETMALKSYAQSYTQNHTLQLQFLPVKNYGTQILCATLYSKPHTTISVRGIVPVNENRLKKFQFCLWAEGGWKSQRSWVRGKAVGRGRVGAGTGRRSRVEP
jgi:hypothetical protein